MSAMTGIFYRDGRKVDPELIKKMNDRLSHRGPDGSAVWVDGSVALGHQMLWTTPESLHEKLPFHDEKAGLVITADARIDNRNELSEELDIEDKEDVSDSYFILKAYEKWGEECPEYLLGDFAFAIWDENEEKLFCARDHMGVKPFYYYLDEEMFVFGTEIKALFCVPNVLCELNEKRIALFLMINDFFEKESTFYENVKSLTAAHSLKLTKNGSRIKRYWKLDPESQIVMGSDEDYASAFLEIFTEAVRCRLRRHGPVGVMLSGGLDSSSVTCTARKIFNENECLDKIHSFSYIFDDFPESDERYFIKKVVDSGGIEPHFIKCDEINPLEKINAMLGYQEQPLSSFQIALVHNSRKIVRDNNVRILLTGEGGDQIVSHAEKYLEELLVTFQWIKLRNNIKDISKARNMHKYKIFIGAVFNVIRYYLIKWPRLYHFLKKDVNVNKDFLMRLKANKSRSLKDKRRAIITSKKFHYQDIDTISHQLTFETIDQGNSIFFIEMRHPFYDKRVVEFCYAIPTEMKIKLGFSRYILRIAMDNILPEQIQWRTTKANIAGASVKNFLSEKNILDQIINDENNLIRKYVYLDKLKKAFKNKRESNPSITILFLWRVVLIYLWSLSKNVNK